VLERQSTLQRDPVRIEKLSCSWSTKRIENESVEVDATSVIEGLTYPSSLDLVFIIESTVLVKLLQSFDKIFLPQSRSPIRIIDQTIPLVVRVIVIRSGEDLPFTAERLPVEFRCRYSSDLEMTSSHGTTIFSSVLAQGSYCTVAPRGDETDNSVTVEGSFGWESVAGLR